MEIEALKADLFGLCLFMATALILIGFGAPGMVAIVAMLMALAFAGSLGSNFARLNGMPEGVAVGAVCVSLASSSLAMATFIFLMFGVMRSIVAGA